VGLRRKTNSAFAATRFLFQLNQPAPRRPNVTFGLHNPMEESPPVKLFPCRATMRCN
jgi:hypothetical protein